MEVGFSAWAIFVGSHIRQMSEVKEVKSSIVPSFNETCRRVVYESNLGSRDI